MYRLLHGLKSRDFWVRGGGVVVSGQQQRIPYTVNKCIAIGINIVKTIGVVILGQSE